MAARFGLNTKQCCPVEPTKRAYRSVPTNWCALKDLHKIDSDGNLDEWLATAEIHCFVDSHQRTGRLLYFATDN